MLCLGRKRNESITIDTGREVIVVHVNQVAGGRAIIGIEAPAHVHVARTELEEREHGQPVA